MRQWHIVFLFLTLILAAKFGTINTDDESEADVEDEDDESEESAEEDKKDAKADGKKNETEEEEDVWDEEEHKRWQEEMDKREKEEEMRKARRAKEKLRELEYPDDSDGDRDEELSSSMDLVYMREIEKKQKQEKEKKRKAEEAKKKKLKKKKKKAKKTAKKNATQTIEAIICKNDTINVTQLCAQNTTNDTFMCMDKTIKISDVCGNKTVNTTDICGSKPTNGTATCEVKYVKKGKKKKKGAKGDKKSGKQKKKKGESPRVVIDEGSKGAKNKTQEKAKPAKKSTDWKNWKGTAFKDRHDKGAYCGACMAIVDEVLYPVEVVSPKRKLTVGGYRWDSKGREYMRQVNYARSETHVTEILENVCEKLENWTVSMDLTGRQAYIRTRDRKGNPISLKYTIHNPEATRTLKFACESLVEDIEDSLLEVIQKGEHNVTERLCINTTSLCKQRDIDSQREAQTMADDKDAQAKEEAKRQEKENEKLYASRMHVNDEDDAPRGLMDDEEVYGGGDGTQFDEEPPEDYEGY